MIQNRPWIAIHVVSKSICFQGKVYKSSYISNCNKWRKERSANFPKFQEILKEKIQKSDVAEITGNHDIIPIDEGNTCNPDEQSYVTVTKHTCCSRVELVHQDSSSRIVRYLKCLSCLEVWVSTLKISTPSLFCFPGFLLLGVDSKNITW